MYIINYWNDVSCVGEAAAACRIGTAKHLQYITIQYQDISILDLGQAVCSTFYSDPPCAQLQTLKAESAACLGRILLRRWEGESGNRVIPE